MTPHLQQIALTGDTSGIGLAIRERLVSEGHSVFGFSRTSGFDLSAPETVTEIICRCADCTVFINCAQHEWAQIDLLYALFAKWKLSARTIINIGSNSGDRTKDFEHKYAACKTALDVACTQLNHVADARCRVINLRPGWTRTPAVEKLNVRESMLAADDVAQMVSWLLQLPAHVHIPTLTMVARS